MSDWNNNELKSKAAYDFCKLLDENDDLRAGCKTNMRTARDTLRDVGQFDNMPAGLPIYVFEDNEEERRKVVAIVLPRKGEMPSPEHFNIKLAWPCTWTPYPQKMRESTKPGRGIITCETIVAIKTSIDDARRD